MFSDKLGKEKWIKISKEYWLQSKNLHAANECLKDEWHVKIQVSGIKDLL